jgi:UPF0042 nucleotide-binding protein
MDVRQADLDRQWGKALGQIKNQGVGIQIVFFEADTPEIIRRYATTRRPHPLENQDLGLEGAVLLERERMAPLRDASDLIVNTTNYSIHDLRRTLQEKWRFLEGKSGHLKVHVMSFGFKYGPPAEADMIFDLRFLPNPYFVDSLRPLSGKDQEIVQYVLGEEPGAPFCPGSRISFSIFCLSTRRRGLPPGRGRGLHRRTASLRGRGRGCF